MIRVDSGINIGRKNPYQLMQQGNYSPQLKLLIPDSTITFGQKAKPKVDCMVMVVAGGVGSRLDPITKSTAKPAVNVLGNRTFIDFVLSNVANSFKTGEVPPVDILTMIKPDGINKHIRNGLKCNIWWPLGGPGSEIETVSPQWRIPGRDKYLGTADAVFQNIYRIDERRPEHVVVLYADHVYRMDYKKMLDFHKAKDADVTIAVVPVPVKVAKGNLGVLEVDENNNVIGFEEKPENPKTMPDKPGYCLASMGLHTFKSEVLKKVLKEDAKNPKSGHDFSKNIIPLMLQKGYKVSAYNFYTQNPIGKHWWDLGDPDSYYKVTMSFLRSRPPFDPDNPKWPIRAVYNHMPLVTRITSSSRLANSIRGYNIISQGCKIGNGVELTSSVLSPGVKIKGPNTKVRRSVLMENVEVAPGCEIRNAIVCGGGKIPPNTDIGVNRKEDIRNGLTVSPGGITIVPPGPFQKSKPGKSSL